MQDLDRPFRGRRLTWAQFYDLRPDRRPANDNDVADNDSRVRVEGYLDRANHAKRLPRQSTSHLTQLPLAGHAQRA